VKIAILNWRDRARPDSGGAEEFVHEVGARWVALGHEVTLYVSAARGLAPAETYDGVRVERIGRLGAGAHHLIAPWRILRRDSPDVVLESINTIPYFLPWRLRRAVGSASLVHQIAGDVWNGHLPVPLAAMARRLEPLLWIPYRGRRVITISESTRLALHEVGLREVVLIPQGGLGHQPLTDKEDVPTFVFVGRLTANKRPDHVVEAFRLIKASLDNARLWIIGGGPWRASLASQLPEGTELLGRLSRGELMSRMGRAHLLLTTSISEGWGLVVTEANALGTPAVGYDRPGLRDSIVDGTTGILVPPSPRALAEAATTVIADRSKYEMLRTAAIKWGSNHSWDTTASDLMEHLTTAN
jgi:glycosyltransferase involved in cell wall biosynthesis